MGLMEKARTALLAVIFGLTGIGCGELTIRTWVTLVEDESGGSVILGADPGSPEFEILRLQGGFLTETVVDTNDILGTMEGTIRLVDVRLAGQVDGAIGKLCTWGNFLGESVGTLSINLLQETVETDLFLDAKATTELSEVFGVPPVALAQQIDFDLGSNLDGNRLANAFMTGSTEGIFETTSVISSDVEVVGLPATFNLLTSITSGEMPPTFDEDLLDYCQTFFRRQIFRDAVYYGINPKSSYLRHLNADRPVDPLVIPLDEIGAVPGDTLRLTPRGSYSMITLAKDGTDTRLGAVFSSSDELLDSSHLDRIVGAVGGTGARLNTWPSIFCLFGLCTDLGGDDIPEDFPIDTERNVVVPMGATHLFVAPVDTLRSYQDNTGFSFGLLVDVNPTY